MHDQKLENTLLFVSLLSALFFAVLGIVWGIQADSGMMIFDGFYSMISMALSAAGILVLKEIRKPEDRVFPFGRFGMEPLLIMARSLILLGLFSYSAIDAAAVIFHGGRSTNIESASIYSMISVTGCAIVFAYLKVRNKNKSALIQAETHQWLGDTLLSTGVFVGFTLAWVLQQTAFAPWVIYVDPVMVIIAVGCFMRFPTTSLIQATKQLLSIAPNKSITDQINSAAMRVLADMPYKTYKIHASQYGRQIDVELNVLAEPDLRMTVTEMDALRAQMQSQLQHHHVDCWINISVTAEEEWL
ncbi:Uncharacterised protein [BD1-7 clade bacterium]|uniref:Cation efflux protein transmembrane domain-containing protein n=1 Tax=BD1-7 clade bacterium TaxID=2029982 RepID=A0A5S9NIV5_9GAMM|nr:Uncharacterised protein [BD1-7 clade bacterium]CAA0093186.1 Uncharacterised protein [BD1-7 clade bacterium]